METRHVHRLESTSHDDNDDDDDDDDSWSLRRRCSTSPFPSGDRPRLSGKCCRALTMQLGGDDAPHRPLGDLALGLFEDDAPQMALRPGGYGN